MTLNGAWHVTPGGDLSGRLRVPGDKSITHRALILGAIATGTTEIIASLNAEDTIATARALTQLGVVITHDKDHRIIIEGRGLRGLQAPSEPLECGNSGTAMRLLAGLLVGQNFSSQLRGDESLSMRPMARIITPLRAMGADITATCPDHPPLMIQPVAALHSIDYDMPIASAQLKSCLLLAGLYADGITRIVEPLPCRDHTERMLEVFQGNIRSTAGEITLRGGGELHGARIEVPADLSSAAFFVVGASITKSSHLVLEGVGVNPERTGILEILRRMGAKIELREERLVSGEPLADLVVSSATLHGITIDPTLVPSCIDEFPAICIAAACAIGETVITGARELRVKESDRINAMAQGLHTLGIEVTALDDGIRIKGGQITGGEIESHGDHRVAMAFAMAGLNATSKIKILDTANVATSFPGFATLSQRAGLGIEASQ